MVAAASTAAGEASTYGTSAEKPVIEQSVDEYVQRWENIWSAGLPAGNRWDKAASAPVFCKLVAFGELDLAGKRCIVPGCGRGYDLVTLARAPGKPAEVLGLELAPSAVAEGNAYLREHLGEQHGSHGVKLLAGDFFKWSESYDMGFDYTFGCAMHPKQRQDWAAAWARLIKPGGTLVTLVFPVDASLDAQQGPPWPVTPQLYTNLLTAAGFTLTSMEPVDPSLSHEGRGGKEFLGLWRR